MKAIQILEERIINLYLTNQISEHFKSTMLKILHTGDKLAISGIIKCLSNPSILSKHNRHATLFAERYEKLKDQLLELHSQKHTKQLFDSLVKKGYLKHEGKGVYKVIYNTSLVPNDLSDQEFLCLMEIEEFIRD